MKITKHKCEHLNKKYDPHTVTIQKENIEDPEVVIRFWVCLDCGEEGEERELGVYGAYTTSADGSVLTMDMIKKAIENLEKV